MTDDAGAVVTEWVLSIALLMLPVVLLVAVLPGWASRQAAAGAAAREGARAAVLAPDRPAADAAARTAVAMVLAGRGIDVGDRVVSVTLPGQGAALPRDGAVTVRVSLTQPPVTLGVFGAIQPPEISGAHTRGLDPRRSR